MLCIADFRQGPSWFSAALCSKAMALQPHNLDHSTPTSSFHAPGAFWLAPGTSSVGRISHKPKGLSFSAEPKENPMNVYRVSALISDSKITFRYLLIVKSDGSESSKRQNFCPELLGKKQMIKKKKKSRWYQRFSKSDNFFGLLQGQHTFGQLLLRSTSPVLGNEYLCSEWWPWDTARSLGTEKDSAIFTWLYLLRKKSGLACIQDISIAFQ